MASRREEKERLRQARLEAEQQAQAAGRRRLVVGYVIAGVLGVVILAGLVIALTGGDDGGSGGEASGDNVNTEFGGKLPEGITVDDRVGTEPPPVETSDLTAAADAAGCKLRLDLRDEGSAHLDPKTDDLPKYGTEPPTSGDHYPVPLADGAFLDQPSPGNFVHSLEHGRVIIQYDPSLPEDDQLALKGVFDADRGGVDLFPDPDMPYAVATTAWTQLMTCEKYEGAATLDAVRAFRDAYRGRGPEAIPY